jgi:hypothetical protein
MISLSAEASMVGDIILQDCGKDFVLPVFLLGLPYAHRRFIQSYRLSLP